jgi:hypothetical protein
MSEQGRWKHIVRLNVRFKAVELELSKRVADDGLQALSHKTLTLKTGEGVVTQVPTSEEAQNDVVDVDDAGDRPGFCMANQEAAVSSFLHAANVGRELSSGRRRRDPGRVQLAARTHPRQELATVFEFGMANANAHVV